MAARRGKGGGRRPDGRRVRYAVVGLGHIAQVAVLPAFRHAARNSELTALVSGDEVKLRRIGTKYRVAHRVRYHELGQLLGSGEIDAVYLALPNDLHHPVGLQVIEAGVHLLCEKPLALTEWECRELIEAARAADLRLMTAYRLHHDLATLEALKLVRAGRIGEPRFFSSTFSMQVTDRDNIRLQAERGGGPVFDLGVYCINAARALFRAEPVQVLGMNAAGPDRRFAEVPEMTFGLLRFPEERIASFGVSFGAGETSAYRIVGTKGDLVVEPGYEYAERLGHRLTIGQRRRTRTFPRSDQFAAELVAFSDAVLKGRDPESSGWEGLADVRVVEALLRSAIEGRLVDLPAFDRERRPDPRQAIRLPPVSKPEPVHARSPRD